MHQAIEIYLFFGIAWAGMMSVGNFMAIFNDDHEDCEDDTKRKKEVNSRNRSVIQDMRDNFSLHPYLVITLLVFVFIGRFFYYIALWPISIYKTINGKLSN